PAGAGWPSRGVAGAWAAEAGNPAGESTRAGRIAGATLAISMVEGETLSVLTAGRPIGGNAPRDCSRWTTNASPGGRDDASASSESTSAGAIGSSSLALISTRVDPASPAIIR